MLPINWKIIYFITFLPLGIILLFILVLKGCFVRLIHLFPFFIRKKTKANILILPYLNYDNASARHRIYKYLPHFEEAGISYHVVPPTTDELYARLFLKWKPWPHYKYFLVLMGNRFLAIWQANNFDVVVVQRSILSEFFLNPPFFIFGLWFINSNIIYDFDDAIYMIPPQSIRSKSRYLNFLARLRFKAHITCCKLVIASTQHLVKKTTIVIGWVGGPGNLLFLKLVEEPLANIAKRHKVILKIVSSKSVNLKGIDTDFQKWNRNIESSCMAEFDIGIMPLSDNEYTKGKCGFKIMQYMASAVPTVASPIGINKNILTHGETGFFAKNTKDWEVYLERLVVDNNLRLKMGKASRKEAEKRFSYNKWAPKFIKLVNKLLTS
jgi:glycosyltransferase involved in cell wall biosynthesis